MRPIAEIDYPKTAEEYWALIDHNMLKLRDLVTEFHPATKFICMYKLGQNMSDVSLPDIDIDTPLVFNEHISIEKAYPITAPAAEQACETIRKGIGKNWRRNPVDVFDEYVKTRNPEIVSLFNETWFGMPESSEVRSVPGFGLLCDLCSECDVLYEGEENAVHGS